MNYLTDEYQQQLAKRYEQRKLSIDNVELANILLGLGFKVDPSTIKKATGGNVSGTFLTPDLAVKIQNSKEKHEFLANKIISENFADKFPIIKTLAYDWFDKTNYEILVMKRGQGRLLLGDFYKLPRDIQKQLFAEILEITGMISELVCSNFGEIRLNHSCASFRDYLEEEFKKYTALVLDQKLCQANDVRQISDYFQRYINIFDDERVAYFNHTDIHTGNVLFEDDHVTLLFDFDGAIKGPKYLSFPKIIGYPSHTFANTQQI